MIFMIFEFNSLKYATYLNMTGIAYDKKIDDKLYPDDFGMIEMIPK